jgi:hypothetical protein
MSTRNARPADIAAALAFAAFLAVGGCRTPAPARLDLGDAIVEHVPGPPAHAVARVAIANGGERELVVHAVTTDCGCRLVSPVPEALASGERVTVVVRCRATVGGPRRRELHVLSSDPDEPRAVRRFALPDTARVAADPAALYFGYVAVGASAARELMLSASDGKGGDDGVTPPVASDPEVTIEARPAQSDGRRGYRVRFAPQVPGPFHGSIDLGPRRGTVPVSGVGFRSVLAFPAEITLPTEVTAGTAPVIALKSVGIAPLTITRVELPPGMTGDVQTTAPGREFRLVIHARDAVDISGPPIRLHTNDPDEPVVTIPLRSGGA